MKQHQKIHRAEERRIVAKVYIEMVHEMRTALRKFNAEEIDKDQSPGKLLLVGAAVTVGSVEGRPMSATKIAHYVHLPRTTVLRKLDTLISIGHTVREGDHYVVAPTAALRAPQYVDRVARVLVDAANKLPRKA